MAELKISDLSVGDWVLNRKGFPTKVQVITSEGNMRYGEDAKPEHSVHIWVSDVKPIPITPEILKSNGWYEDDYDTCTDYITDNTIIMYNKERKDWKACIMNGSPVVQVKVFFSYVHELQHALRLAGLNEDIKL